MGSADLLQHTSTSKNTERIKKILIIDNHDDFGGHAKRNEHTIDGQLRLGHGGSQSIVEPKHGSEKVHALLKDIGVDVERFKTAYDKNFYEKEQSRGCYLLQQRNIW